MHFGAGLAAMGIIVSENIFAFLQKCGDDQMNT
jgi:hypothetical protein